MREKKFRAWDKVAKKFLYPWTDGFHILGETTCFDLIGQQLKERNPEKSTLSMLNDIEITEYTGLKDKKGKDIYEGDIVKYDGYYVGDYWTEKGQDEVKYDDGCYFGGNGELDIGAIYIKNIEIIGNIYENKDLLID